MANGQSNRQILGGMTHVLKQSTEDDQTSSSDEENGDGQGISDSSLSNYTHTEDVRRMFAKSPADLA